MNKIRKPEQKLTPNLHRFFNGGFLSIYFLCICFLAQGFFGFLSTIFGTQVTYFIFIFGNCQDRNRTKIHHRADGHGNLGGRFPQEKLRSY